MNAQPKPLVNDNPYDMVVWEVTPDMAKDLLNRIPDYQRNLRPRKVESYMRDMVTGEWVLTHQPIAIDEDGNLADGRHRCAACVLAGVSFLSYVAIGVPKNVYRYIDTGTARSVTDVSALNSQEAAIVRAIFYLTPGSSMTALSHSEILRFWEENRASLSTVCGHTKHKISGLVLTSSDTNAAIWRAYHHMSFDDYNRVIHLMWASEHLEQRRVGDGSILLLRDHLLAGIEQKRFAARWKDTRRIRYAKTERAIRAFLEGRDLGRLLPGDGTEQFPMPNVDDGIFLGRNK